MMITGTGQLGVRRSGNTVYVSHFQSGVVLEANVILPNSPQQYYINVRVFVPRTHMGQVQGFYGNFDGNPNNDFSRRDGSVIVGGGAARSIGLATCRFHYTHTHCQWSYSQSSLQI